MSFNSKLVAMPHLRTILFAPAMALLSHMPLSSAAPPSPEMSRLLDCLSEGAEYTKMGLFFSLGINKETVLHPVRFSTGVSEQRRKAIVEEIYETRPENHRLFARQVFMRCTAPKPALYSPKTLEYCFSLQARLVEFFVARDGAVPESEVLSQWNAEMQSRPDVIPWGEIMIKDIYESKKSFPELAPFAFIGCAEKRYRREQQDGN